MRELRAQLLLVLIVPIIAAHQWTHEWTHHSWLDSDHKYLLRWKSDDTSETITFLVEVQTKGWVGFGISPNGGMTASDLVIGWVDSYGHTFFHDRHANGTRMPDMDESQDYNLLLSSENETHTTLMFSRPYLTCDTRHDIEITRDTTKLIYAFGDNDPISVDNIEMHAHRGTKSVLLLLDQRIKEPTEDDLQFTDFIVNNITIPSESTTYWCKVFKVQMSHQRHVVKYGPNIKKGNEELTHHFVLFACGHPENNKLDKYLSSEGIDCSDSANMPVDMHYCLRPYFVWAVGGQPFIAPPEAGFPIGFDDETTYFLLQIHYNNPDNIENRLDSSGLRAFHTSKLRPNEAYTLATGSVTDFGLVIPPKQKHFKIAGHCQTDCFKNFLPESGLTLFASLPHSHYLGRQIKTRHFRNGAELPWIEFDKNYDFNYQQFRPLRTPVTVLLGDLITTECVYDSSLRPYATLGGLPTDSEMCLNFFSYYPRMRNNSQMCLSGMTTTTIMAISGIEEVTQHISNNDPVIILPRSLQNESLSKYLYTKDDWNPDLVNNSQYLIQYSPQRQNCYWIKTSTDFELDTLVEYPKHFVPYSPPLKPCKSQIMQRNSLINAGFILKSFNQIFQLLIIFFIHKSN